jgi:DNA repair photolyase
MILSVSRRTDIPAFYSDWFMNRIKEGYVLVRNPMNYHSISRVNINPDVVDCIVFWTKNPAPLLPYLDDLGNRYKFYFQYTLNAYGSEIEPNLPSLDERIETFIKISQYLGSDRVIWRYDPVIITERYTIEWHKKAFNYISSKLSGHTESCVFSYLDMYDKISNNMKSINIQSIDANLMKSIAVSLNEIAKTKNIRMKTCSEEIDLNEVCIEHSCCIDPVLISKMIGCNLRSKKDPNQRSSCGCVESVDIGQYNTCQHGCKYCYANYSLQSVVSNLKKHDPHSPMLLGNVEEGDKVTERKVQSLVDNQLSLF